MSQAWAKKRRGPVLFLGVPSLDPDLEYASGFHAPDPVVFLLERDGGRLVVADLEAGRAERQSCAVEVYTPTALKVPRARRGRHAEWAVALLRRRGIRSVSVPPHFPAGVVERLRRSRIRVRVERGTLLPQRAVKTAAEIAKVRESQQAAVIAMRTAQSLIGQCDVGADGTLWKKGERLTSEAVRRTIVKVLVDHDCTGRGVIVAGGRQASDPHEVGHGPLRAHEAIVMDIFPQHMVHGYWGDLTRTVVKGTPSQELKQMYHAVKAAQAAALARLRPGVKACTVHRCAGDLFRARGFDTCLRDGRPVGFIHSTGHGVGLGIHEAPSLGLSEQRLRSGNIVTVEPGLYYPDIGGVRIEDTVVITPDGWRYLAPCEKRFEW